MTRAPLQINVIPFRKNENGQFEFAVFHRSDGTVWQFVSGGAEDDETPAEAAKRELKEEIGITAELNWIALDSRASIPKNEYPHITHWPKEILVLPQFSFAVDVTGQEIILSREHDDFRWLSFDDSNKLLKWDSDKVALWELNERLKRK